MSEHGQQHERPPERDYADLDIPLGVILKFGIGLALLVVVTFWGAKHFLHGLSRTAADQDQPVSEFALERVVPPEPRLQVDEQRTLEEQRALEQKTLETYGWVDKANGIVRIPMDRAIDLIAERGLPARPTK
jgi:hypothetical protein